MHIQILTPEKIVFDNEAYGIQLPGINGSFEMLDLHAPMVAALGKGSIKLLLDKNNSATETFEMDGGIVEINNNKAIVLVESIN